MRILNSTSAPTTTALTTRATVVEDVGQFATDKIIDRYIDQASDEIGAWVCYPSANPSVAGETTHPLAESSYAETLRLTSGVRVIDLSRWFLKSKPTLTIDGIAVDPAEIEARLGIGAIYRLSAGARVDWPAGVIVVSYSAGFKLPGDPDPTPPSRRAPPSIERAAIDLVSFRFGQATGTPCGQPLQSIAAPDVGTLTFAAPTAQPQASVMPPHVAALLRPYQFQSLAFE